LFVFIKDEFPLSFPPWPSSTPSCCITMKKSCPLQLVHLVVI
jgi:hypothetical protein